MKKLQLLFIPILALFVIGGCGSDDNSKKIQKSTIIKTTALDTTQEWQPNPVIKNSYLQAKEYCENLILDDKNDWRLPTPKDFFALLDNSKSIDSYFPKNSDIKKFYTDTQTLFDKDQVWVLSAWSNTLTYTNKNEKLGVRCVRGEKLPSHTFEKESDGVKDINEKTSKTLFWQDIEDNGKKIFTINQAKKYCQDKDLRVPTISELLELYDIDFTHKAKDSFISFWSLTTLPTNSKHYLSINYNKGVHFNTKTTKNYVRCVKDINNAPTAQSINYGIYEDKNLSITLNASDSDGDDLSYYIESNPTNGTLSGDIPSLIYTPNPNFHGNDSFSFKAYDGQAYSNIATIGITVIPSADKPTIKSTNINTSENASVVSGKIDVINPDNLSLKYILKSNIAGFSLDSNGSFTFDPSNTAYDLLKQDEMKVIPVTIRVEDSSDYSLYDEENIFITIRGKNDAPEAFSDYYSINQNSTNLTIYPLNNDKDIDSNHVLSISSIKSHISYINISHDNTKITIDNFNMFKYLNKDQNQTIKFQYTIKDEYNATSDANITIIIKGLNDAPVAKATVNGNFNFGEFIKFDANLSYDLDDNSILTYKWVEGTNILSTNKTFSKNDFQLGNHVVTLIVKDEYNATSSQNINFTIIDQNITMQLPKTFQTFSVKDYDDGYYQKGADANFTKDEDIVIDHTLGLVWQDNSDILAGTKTWTEANATCNNLYLNGKDDWRLPNAHELFFLVNKNPSSSTHIDSSFNYTPLEYFWTSAKDFNNSKAIYIDFEDANMDTEDVDNSKYVRCVRGDGKYIPNRKRDNNLEVVIDHTLKLMWSDNNESNITTKNWQDAIDYCEDATFAGKDDWRLPNIHELYSIATPFQHIDAFDNNFKYITNQQYWSSTYFYNYSGELNQYYNVNFDDGIEYEDSGFNELYVRCVRDILP